MCIKNNSTITGKELKKLIRVTRIDECMKEEIFNLNKQGIKTLACCCGHKKYPKTIIYKKGNEIYDLISGVRIPRTERFYVKDKQCIFFIPESIGIKKTEDIGEYKNLHIWIKKQWLKKYKSKPHTCKRCHKKKKLEVANISGNYKKNLSDWEWICKSCHNISHQKGKYKNHRFKESLQKTNAKNYKKNKKIILKHKKVYWKEFYKKNGNRLREKGRTNYWKKKIAKDIKNKTQLTLI